ncbi:integrase core domain-containing protein [Streptomyces flaveus]|uniref:integrase core domain-containing protein n=1 Tax=Streptomyces flaveus TaxID=66370 RepID=UPI0033336E63
MTEAHAPAQDHPACWRIAGWHPDSSATPTADAVEATAAKYAADWPAWGHRKIAAMMRADGCEVSTSTVERALRRRGLLLPSGFRADRRSWARLRKRVFRDPPRQRNRVWQTDFSEFETARGGIWRICAVIDYATKYCLAATVTPTSRGADALACLRHAVVEAERVLDLDDLRADRGEMDVVDADDYVIGQTAAPIAVVTDNGPCFRGGTFAEAFTGDDPLLRHVRTRVRSPQTNGVVERFFGTLTYEHLYRAIIGDGNALADEINQFRHTYNTLPPTRHSTTGRRDRRTSPARRASSHRSGRPLGDPYPDGSSAVKNRIDPAGTSRSPRNTAPRDPWVARSPR